MLGIPLIFGRALYLTARPKERPSGLTIGESAAWDKLQARRESRYIILYEIYTERAWFWELTELFRKCVMTSMVLFIAPGLDTQVAHVGCGSRRQSRPTLPSVPHPNMAACTFAP